MCHTAVDLCAAQWNPSNEYPDLLAVSLSSGLLQLLCIKDDVSVVCSKADVHAVSGKGNLGLVYHCCVKSSLLAVCWSPKGKQIAAGLRNGEVVQIGLKKVTNCLYKISPYLMNLLPPPLSND